MIDIEKEIVLNFLQRRLNTVLQYPLFFGEEHSISSIIESIESVIQLTKNEIVDTSLHTNWNRVLGCTCPKIQDLVLLGKNEKIISSDCLFHKKYQKLTLDIKDENGLFVKQKTRAGRLWGSVVQRTSSGSSIQNRDKGYVGSVNEFKDFQHFAEWCQDQDGYMNRDENGKFWQLDKDLLIPGNKSYSPNLCIFVPSHVNTIFLDGGNKSKKGLPFGVSKPYSKSFYATSSGIGGGFLGKFDTAQEAHLAWQMNKLDKIRNLHDKHFTKQIDIILERVMSYLQYDIDNGLETKQVLR